MMVIKFLSACLVMFVYSFVGAASIACIIILTGLSSHTFGWLYWKVFGCMLIYSILNSKVKIS